MEVPRDARSTETSGEAEVQETGEDQTSWGKQRRGQRKVRAGRMTKGQTVLPEKRRPRCPLLLSDPHSDRCGPRYLIPANQGLFISSFCGSSQGEQGVLMVEGVRWQRR